MWLLNATISWFEMGLRPMEFDIIKPKAILFDDNIDMTTSKNMHPMCLGGNVSRGIFQDLKKYSPLHENQSLHEVHDHVAWWEYIPRYSPGIWKINTPACVVWGASAVWHGANVSWDILRVSGKIFTPAWKSGVVWGAQRCGLVGMYPEGFSGYLEFSVRLLSSLSIRQACVAPHSSVSK